MCGDACISAAVKEADTLVLNLLALLPGWDGYCNHTFSIHKHAHVHVVHLHPQMKVHVPVHDVWCRETFKQVVRVRSYTCIRTVHVAAPCKITHHVQVGVHANIFQAKHAALAHVTIPSPNMSHSQSLASTCTFTCVNECVKYNYVYTCIKQLACMVMIV